MCSIPPAAPAPTHVLKTTDICKDRSLGRHTSVFTSLRSPALKIPPPPPPHHGARLRFSNRQVNRTWGLQSTRPTAFLHVGGESLTPEVHRRDLQEASRLPREQAGNTFPYKKRGRARVPPTQPPYPPRPAPNCSLPLGTSGPAMTLSGSTDEKLHSWSGWECEFYQKALNCQASTCIFYADYSSPDSLGISLASHGGMLIN